jgi:tetratricopeptide (TPR) repeat protein
MSRERHLDYFLRLAQKAESHLYGFGQTEWLQKLENERENMEAALEWSLSGNIIGGQHLVIALWRSWNLDGRISDGYKWLQKMLAIDPTGETIVRARILSGAGSLAGELGDFQASAMYSKESVTLFRKLGNDIETAYPLSMLGLMAMKQSTPDFLQSTQLLNESLTLARKSGNRWLIHHCLFLLGEITELQWLFTQAREYLTPAKMYFEESLTICKAIGDQEGISLSLFWLATLAEDAGDIPQAILLKEEALQIARSTQIKFYFPMIIEGLGITLLGHGDYARSQLLFEESLEYSRKVGYQIGICRSLTSLGFCARLQGDYSKSCSCYYEGLNLAQQINNDHNKRGYLLDIGLLLGAQGHPEKFVRLLGTAEAIFPDTLKLLYPFSLVETQQYIETAHTTLGDEAYNAAYEAGKQMTLDEAVALALKELEQ